MGTSKHCLVSTNVKDYFRNDKYAIWISVTCFSSGAVQRLASSISMLSNLIFIAISTWFITLWPVWPFTIDIFGRACYICVTILHCNVRKTVLHCMWITSNCCCNCFAHTTFYWTGWQNLFGVGSYKIVCKYKLYILSNCNKGTISLVMVNFLTEMN